MVCEQCGGLKAVKLVVSDSIGMVLCLTCGHGSHIPQPKPSEVFSFRAQVDKLQEIERLRKEMNRGMAHELLAEITDPVTAAAVIDGTYQGGQL